MNSAASRETQEEEFPIVRPLPSNITPLEVFRVLAGDRYPIFFDSAMPHPTLGRYSFLAADPFDWIEIPAKGTAPLDQLAQALQPYRTSRRADLPPFQGGAAGLLGYELSQSLENIPSARQDEFKLPALAVGLYDVVVAFDHLQQQGWIISQGLPEQTIDARRQRAIARAEQVWQKIVTGPQPLNRPAPCRLDRAELAPQFEVPGHELVTSNMSRDNYLAAVGRGVEYIHSGDVFQVNLAQRLICPAGDDAVSLYLRLRECNAAPFAAYFDAGRFQLASASPERFLQVVDRTVETRPIKGTRPRTARPEADLFAGDELASSRKDRAENIMIVDLMRNDLARVCTSDSVQVTKLCHLEPYAYVLHLVSVVQGILAPQATPIDLLRATFPGGSITGAPKVRAMEIISELEPTARGAYCGSLCYLGFDGTMDSSILIRTVTAAAGWWQLPVGGGIVADSQAAGEYEETWHKARGMLRALTP